MKKKIIALILCALCVMSNCLCIFAQTSMNNDYTIEELNYSVAWEEFQEMMPGVDLNKYNAYISYEYYNGYHDGYRIRLISKNDILVRVDVGEGDYYYYVYYYDGVKMQQGYSPYQFCITEGYQYTDNQILAWWGAANGTNVNYRYMLKGVPVATSVENALLYYQTMDVSYLENASDFVEVPTPKNVSMYKASDENALYVYYENDDFAYPEDTVTRLHGNYHYKDASGNDVTISAIPQIDVEYVNRGQIKVDLSAIEEYDTGYVVIFLNNCYANSVDSNWVNLKWHKGEGSYMTSVIVDGNATDIRENVLTDYGSKNNSYTGGNNNDFISSIPSASQGDFSFLGGIFNGFGLLGNNGLIALLGNTFSYLPSEIFAILALGVSAMLIIALFKLLVS